MATWFDERALGEGVDLEALVNPSTSAGGGKKKGKKGKDKKPKVQRGVKQEVRPSLPPSPSRSRTFAPLVPPPVPRPPGLARGASGVRGRADGG